MIGNWFRNRRRAQWMRRPLSDHQLGILSRNLWHWSYLSESQQQRMQGLVTIFLKQKYWEGCDGLRVTEEMRVTVAGAACLLLLGFNDTWCFDPVRTILLYPRPILTRQLRTSEHLVDEAAWVSGMAARGAAMTLSWADVRHDCGNPDSLNNVVIHEFAHYVDGLDGAMDGTPPFTTRELSSRWVEVSKAEFAALQHAASVGTSTVLDHYGAGHITEFFAVATEAFFCDPVNLAESHAELYRLLEALYRLDPKQWF